jgi:hypothetical protein
LAPSDTSHLKQQGGKRGLIPRRGHPQINKKIRAFINQGKNNQNSPRPWNVYGLRPKQPKKLPVVIRLVLCGFPPWVLVDFSGEGGVGVCGTWEKLYLWSLGSQLRWRVIYVNNALFTRHLRKIAWYFKEAYRALCGDTGQESVTGKAPWGYGSKGNSRFPVWQAPP